MSGLKSSRVGHPTNPKLTYGVTAGVHPTTGEPVVFIDQPIPNEHMLVQMADEKTLMLCIPVLSFPAFQRALREQAAMARRLAQGSIRIRGIPE